MGTVFKRHDRLDWLRWAIAFMHHGLWLADEIDVWYSDEITVRVQPHPEDFLGDDGIYHVSRIISGPQESTDLLQGNAWAKVDGTTGEVKCCITAKGRSAGSCYLKYHLCRVHIRVCDDSRPYPVYGKVFPRIKASALTPKARRYLRALERTAEKLLALRLARLENFIDRHNQRDQFLAEDAEAKRPKDP